MKTMNKYLLLAAIVFVAHTTDCHAYTSNVQAVKSMITSAATALYLSPEEVYSSMTVTNSNQTSSVSFMLYATNSQAEFVFDYTTYDLTNLTYVSKTDHASSSFDINYYDDGTPSKYAEGLNKFDGLMVEFHKNGEIRYLGYMVSNKFIGEAVFFDEEGSVEVEHIYTNAIPMNWGPTP